MSAGVQTPDLAGFKAQIAPVFTSTCIACHGPEKQKGKFRVDTLDPDLLKGGDVAKWLKVSDVIGNGEMPPEDEKPLDPAKRAAMVAWLGAELQKASQVQRSAQGPTAFRRMASYEYNYALQDLLGLPYEFAANLPPESISEDGFKNSSAMLQMSAMQFDYYRQIGLAALKKATVHGDRPQPVTYRITMPKAMEVARRMKARGLEAKDEENAARGGEAYILDPATGTGVFYGYSYDGGRWGLKPDAGPGQEPAVSPVVAVIPPGARMMLDLGDYLPDAGVMRVRIRAARTGAKDDGYAALRLVFGGQTSNNANFSQVVSDGDRVVTADAEHPQVIEFRVPLGEIPRNPFLRIAKLGGLPNPAEVLTIQNTGEARPPRRQPVGRRAHRLRRDHRALHRGVAAQDPHRHLHRRRRARTSRSTAARSCRGSWAAPGAAR